MRTFYFYLLTVYALIPLSGLNATEAATTMSEIADIISPFAREHALHRQLKTADAAECATYLAQLQTLPAPYANSLRHTVLNRWAAFDPKGALAAALTIPLPQRDSALKTVMRRWSQDNPTEAFRALLPFEKTAEARALVDGFFQGYAQLNPQAALNFFIDNQYTHPWLFVYSEKNLIGGIVRKWAKIAPAEAFATLITLKEENAQYIPLEELLIEWIRENHTDCIRALKALPANTLAECITTLWQQTIPAVAFPDMFALIRTLPESQSGWLLREFMENMARENAKMALPFLINLKHKEKSAIVEAFFNGWADNNFDAAMQEAVAMETPALRNAAMRGIWASKKQYHKPTETIKAMLAIPDKIIRKRAIEDFTRDFIINSRGDGDIGSIMRALPDLATQRAVLLSLLKSKEGYPFSFTVHDRKNAEILRDWAMCLPPGENRVRLLQSALAETMTMEDLYWAEEHLSYGEKVSFFTNNYQNPTTAEKSILTVENFNALPEGTLKDALLQRLAATMAQTSPEKTHQWLSSLPENKARDAAYGIFLMQLIRGDKLDLALDAMRNPPEGLRISGNTLGYFAKNLSEKDPQGAIVWAMQLDKKSQREDALDGIADYWAKKTDPTEFFTMIVALGKTQEADGVLKRFLINQSYNAPEKTAAWISANMQTYPLAAAAAVNPSLSSWVSRDPMAATQWLASLPEGDVRERAIVALGNSSETEKSPADVLAWVVTLPEKTQNGETRIKIVGQIAERIKETSPNKLPQLLENNKLTPKEREAIQKVIDR